MAPRITRKNYEFYLYIFPPMKDSNVSALIARLAACPGASPHGGSRASASLTPLFPMCYE